MGEGGKAGVGARWAEHPLGLGVAQKELASGDGLVSGVGWRPLGKQ